MLVVQSDMSHLFVETEETEKREKERAAAHEMTKRFIPPLPKIFQLRNA